MNQVAEQATSIFDRKREIALSIENRYKLLQKNSHNFREISNTFDVYVESIGKSIKEIQTALNDISRTEFMDRSRIDTHLEKYMQTARKLHPLWEQLNDQQANHTKSSSLDPPPESTITHQTYTTNQIYPDLRNSMKRTGQNDPNFQTVDRTSKSLQNQLSTNMYATNYKGKNVSSPRRPNELLDNDSDSSFDLNRHIRQSVHPQSKVQSDNIYPFRESNMMDSKSNNIKHTTKTTDKRAESSIKQTHYRDIDGSSLESSRRSSDLSTDHHQNYEELSQRSHPSPHLYESGHTTHTPPFRRKNTTASDGSTHSSRQQNVQDANIFLNNDTAPLQTDKANMSYGMDSSLLPDRSNDRSSVQSGPGNPHNSAGSFEGY